jgi:hypothetical protein
MLKAKRSCHGRARLGLSSFNSPGVSAWLSESQELGIRSWNFVQVKKIQSARMILHGIISKSHALVKVMLQLGSMKIESAVTPRGNWLLAEALPVFPWLENPRYQLWGRNHHSSLRQLNSMGREVSEIAETGSNHPGRKLRLHVLSSKLQPRRGWLGNHPIGIEGESPITPP